MGVGGGYREVLADGPVRRLLVASLTGRLAFGMLPLGFVLFAAANAGTAAAGILVAAFSATSVLAPARGRIVDRRGPPALIGFAFACSGALVALAVAGSADAPAVVLVVVGGLAGLAVPPLGPFTRAAWGRTLRGEPLQRVFALDSAGEEAMLIVAPLAVAAIVAVASTEAALFVAAAGLLGGTAAAGRSVPARRIFPGAPAAKAAAGRLPLALWLTIASLLAPGAALGAIDLAVPALARSAGAPARAGLLLAALAAGTATASLLAGRRTWTWPATRRLPALMLAVAGALAGAAAVAGHPVALAIVLVAVGMALGALFVTVYPLVDELAPAGAATRSFAWLVTANNAGIGIGAALAGQLHGAAGLWLAAGCALAGVPVTLAIGMVRTRADIARHSLGRSP